MTKAEEAFAIVKRVGLTVRSAYIAEELDCTADNVHELLAPRVLRGELISCNVVVGGEHFKDYRLAVALGGSAPEIVMTGRQPQPPKVPIHVLGKSDGEPEAQRPPRTVAPRTLPFKAESTTVRTAGAFDRSLMHDTTFKPKKENSTMATVEKIAAAFKAHGPMTTRELRKHMGGESVSVLVATCGRFKKLGGEKFNFVWGLPDQKLSDRQEPEQERAPAQPAKKPRRTPKRKNVKTRKKRAAKIARAEAAAARLAAKQRAQVLAFRPALTVDGVIQLTGQARPGELSGPEVRVLRGFLDRLDGAGAL